MDKSSSVITQAETFVKRELEFDTTGHDWWHIDRVRQLALEIAKKEQANEFVCELSALLHDVADEKLNDSKEAGLDKVKNWLSDNIEDMSLITHVMTIISTMSYNGGHNPPMETVEGRIVQDADRLDALGAIGIARTFLYSGSRGQSIHSPGLDFTQAPYRSNHKTAIYHFYEKLLKLKDLMHTQYAKELAESRHHFMEEYLKQFYKEWNISEN